MKVSMAMVLETANAALMDATTRLSKKYVGNDISIVPCGYRYGETRGNQGSRDYIVVTIGFQKQWHLVRLVKVPFYDEVEKRLTTLTMTAMVKSIVKEVSDEIDASNEREGNEQHD